MTELQNAPVKLPGEAMRTPATTSELLLGEMQLQSKLLTKIESNTGTVATAAQIFIVLFVIGIVVALLQFGGTFGGHVR